MNPLVNVGIVLACIILWILGAVFLIGWNMCAHYDPRGGEDYRDGLKTYPKNWPHTSGS